MNRRYDPKYYSEKIKDTIKEALKNGMRIDINENEIIIENTVSETEEVVSLKNLWKRFLTKYEIKVKYENDYFPQEEYKYIDHERLHIPQVITVSNGYIYFYTKNDEGDDIIKLKDGTYICEHDVIVGLTCIVEIKEVGKIEVFS